MFISYVHVAHPVQGTWDTLMSNVVLKLFEGTTACCLNVLGSLQLGILSVPSSYT